MIATKKEQTIVCLTKICSSLGNGCFPLHNLVLPYIAVGFNTKLFVIFHNKQLFHADIQGMCNTENMLIFVLSTFVETRDSCLGNTSKLCTSCLSHTSFS